MNDASRKAHWENVYSTKGENEVSWFQESPAPSLELMELAKPAGDAAIVDIGAGASRLVDELLAPRVLSLAHSIVMQPGLPADLQLR